MTKWFPYLGGFLFAALMCTPSAAKKGISKRRGLVIGTFVSVFFTPFVLVAVRSVGLG